MSDGLFACKECRRLWASKKWVKEVTNELTRVLGELKLMKDDQRETMSELEDLKIKLAKAIEALRWYAERDHLEAILFRQKFVTMHKTLSVREVAQKALEEIENG